MSAEFVLEMAWKSTVLAISVLILLAVMRRQDPSHRAAVGGLGLALLPLLPLIVLAVAVLPVPSIELPAPASTVRAVPATMDPGAVLFPLAGPEPQVPAVPVIEPETVVGALWAVGALLVLLRLGAGLLTLWRWSRKAERMSSPAWTKVMRKCGAPEDAVLLVSDSVSAPLSWGWRRPVILVNRDTLANRQEAEAIIAHEAAHLSRLDWPRLLAARFAVALFWFNPLVWLLERRHLQDVEEAADLQATHRIEPTRYAQTLLNVARGRTAPLGANSMACGTLSKRISQILSPRAPSPRGRMWRSGALAGVAMIVGPVALTQFVAPAVSAAVASTPEIASKAIPAPVATMASAAVVPVANPVAAAPPPRPIADVSEPAAVIRAVVSAVAAVQATPATEPRPIIDQTALAATLRAAEEARANAEIVARDAQEMAARAQAEAAKAMAAARVDMLRGADDMERGAIDMRKGAATMREEARKLRNPAYRAEQIRKAQARGDHHIPTDQELIDAIPKMEDGARKMDAGVDDMRRGAQKMREQARRS